MYQGGDTRQDDDGKMSEGREGTMLGPRVTLRVVRKNGPAFLLVELVPHTLAQSLELSL